MHIAFWSPAWPLEKYQNGVITYVHWMKRELERQGHKISVFTGELDSSTREANVYHVTNVHRPLWIRAKRRLLRSKLPTEHDVFDFSTAIAAQILEVHRDSPIDVIEMEESFGWFADIGKLTRIPLLVKLHGPSFLSLVEEELATPFGRERVDREGNALKWATAIVAPSQSTLVSTLQRYELTPMDKGHIVNPMTMDDDTPLWRLDACDPNTILFVGRFDLHKGADVVLKAFRSVLRVFPSAKLIFAGPDIGLPGEDGRRIQFDSYRDSLFPAELRDRVDFRGRLANKEVAKLRTQAMVTVVASRWESQGYTLLEAMLQGCPVVSTDAGGCAESVAHGVNGLLAKSGVAEDFAAQVCAILEDPQRAALMGQVARRHVLQQHSAARVAAASVEIYDKIIARHRQ